MNKDGDTFQTLSERISAPKPQESPVRIYDVRSKAEKQNEKDGVAGKDLPPETNVLIQLLIEARSWGRSHNWPSHDDYPQRSIICAIGEKINEDMGFDGMQRVAYYINSRNSDLVTHLNQFWHGIGSWMA